MFFRKKKRIEELERELEEEKSMKNALLKMEITNECFYSKNKKHDYKKYNSWTEYSNPWDVNQYTEYICANCGKKKRERKLI